MRLRPLFSKQLNNSSKNKSRSLHNCPFCECESSTSRFFIKDSKNNDQNIYTHLQSSNRNLRQRKQKRYLNANQTNKSMSNEKHHKNTITEKVVKQKYQQPLLQTSFFKNANSIQKQSKSIPIGFQNISNIQKYQQLDNFKSNIYNHKQNQQNISIKYTSPQLIHYKSQNYMTFFSVNSSRDKSSKDSLFIRQPNRSQFTFYKDSKIVQTPIYHKNTIQQKKKQKSQTKSSFHKLNQNQAKYIQKKRNSFHEINFMNLNQNNSLSYSCQPSQPKILLQKKNKKFNTSPIQSSQESSDLNNNHGLFQKSQMTGTGSIQGSKSSSNNNIILQSKQDSLNPINSKRNSQKKISMNKNVKGNINQNIYSIINNNIQTNNKSKDQDFNFKNIQDQIREQKSSIRAIYNQYNSSFQININSPKQLFNKVQQLANQTLKISTPQQQLSKNRHKNILNIIQQANSQNQSSNNKNTNPIKISSNTNALNESIKRNLPYTQTTKSIQLNIQSKYNNKNINQQLKYITTLEKNVFAKNKEQNYKNNSKIQKQNHYVIKQKMSRSKSNQNKDRKKSKSFQKQLSKTLIQHGKQSKKLANQIIKQLQLYYKYFDISCDIDYSIN